MQSHRTRLEDIIHQPAFLQLRVLMKTLFQADTWILTADFDLFGPTDQDPSPACFPENENRCPDRYTCGVIRRLCRACGESRSITKTRCPESGHQLILLPVFSGKTTLGYWIFEREADDQDVPGEDLPAPAEVWPKPGESGCGGGKDGLNLTSSAYETLIFYIHVYNQRMTDLIRSRNMFKTFVDSSSAYMYICDYHTGEMLMINEKYAELAGLPIRDVIGRQCWEIETENGKSFCGYCPRDLLIDAHGAPTRPVTNTIYNPKYKQWQLCTNQAFEWLDGRLAHGVTIIDLSKEHEMEEKLHDLAYFDQRTYLHLPNRMRLFKDIEDTLETGQDTFPHLIFFNIAAMKQLNDVYGRESGDVLLQRIAEEITVTFGPYGRLYNMKSDEFCFMPFAQHAEHTHALACGIERRFSEPWNLKNNEEETPYYCGISIVVFCALPLIAFTELPDLVRRMLGISRKTRKMVLYNAQMDHEIKKRTSLILDMKHCVRHHMKGFEVHYQPMIEATTQKWKAVEALCRWTSSTWGQISPAVFIPLAEQNGIIKEVGRWVLETAIAQCKQLRLDTYDGFFLSVNVSPVQIMEDDFSTLVKEVLEQNAFPAEKLTLEVTENSQLIFNEHTMKVINDLVTAGVHLALDDFGTGYSNYEHIRHLPMRFLKTERSFIRGIEEDGSLQTFYRCICDLAHASKISIIAEGIETEEQMHVTMHNGADYFQGFLFSKPLSAEGFARNQKCFDRRCSPHLEKTIC